MSSLRIQAVVSFIELKRALMKLKKYSKDGLYAEVEELTHDEALAIWRMNEKYFLNEWDFKTQLFHLRIFGPTIRIPKPSSESRNYLVVQFNKDGPTSSMPLTKKQAYTSAENAQGVVSYVCKIEKIVNHAE